MPYSVRYTDFQNKGEIFVEDGVINSDTSIGLPGKGATGYGQTVAENFLHILENFAGPNEPENPVEGQLWYDTSLNVDQLKVYDATQWKPAAGFTKSASEPPAIQSEAGDLWVDTNNQQLFVYTGNSWTLIGPEFGSGLLTGGIAETVVDINNANKQIFSIKINDVPFLILSGEEFTPKAKISGFTVIKQGLNIRNDNPTVQNNPIKFSGVAESAKALTVETATGSETIQSENFIRRDAIGIMNASLKVKTNDGMTVGLDDQFAVKINGNSVELRNETDTSSVDVILREQQSVNTVLRVTSQQKVGINNLAPTAELDVIGNIKITPFASDATTGTLEVNNTTDSTTFSNGSFTTAGGAGIAQNLNVGGDVGISGATTLGGNVLPNSDNVYNIGAELAKFNNMYANNFIGSVQGDVTGRLNGIAERANQLTNATTFSVTGDVEADSFDFDGQSGGNTKTFNMSIKNSFIANKTPITSVDNSDEILINKTTGNTGVYKVSKNDLLKSVPITPVGTLVPYAGQTAPAGWLLCDGSVVLKSDYNDLWNTIGHSFRDPNFLADGGSLSFALPDMRGRVALGLDNIGGQNANRVTTSISSFNNIRPQNTLGTGFDAVFAVQTDNGAYDVQITEAGQNYRVGDRLLVTGNIFGGASPTHDLAITVTSVTNGGITAFTFVGLAFEGFRPDDVGSSGGGQSRNIKVENLPEHEHDLQGNQSQFYAVSQRPQDPNNPGQLQTDADAIPVALEAGATGFQGIPNTGGVGGGSTLGVPVNVMNPFLALNYIIYAGA